MSEWCSTLYNGFNGISMMADNMSVIGNNIANASTTGFKTSSSCFQDILDGILNEGMTVSNR